MRKFIPFLVILSATFLGLLMAEIITRIAMPNLPDPTWETDLFCRDTTLDMRIMKPNIEGRVGSLDFPYVIVKSNSKGYRDSEWSGKKKSMHRLMVLGDSFTWGWGVPIDSIFTNILDESDSDLSVYNLGIPGDDLYRMYSRFRYHFQEIQPTHLLIVNYINDFYWIENQRQSIERSKSAGFFDRQRTISPNCNRYYPETLKRLLMRSYLIRLMNTLRLNVRSFSRTERIALQNRELKEKAYRPELESQRDSTWFKAPSDFYRTLLKEISEKTEVTIVYIPPPFHADSALSAELKELIPDVSTDPWVVNRGIARLASEFDNVSFIDPTGELLEKGKAKSLYFPMDGHLNTEGQCILGRYLIGRLNYRHGNKPSPD